jgi:hypothetical protein
MILEYLEGSLRITQAATQNATIKAAEWIGLLHSRFQKNS